MGASPSASAFLASDSAPGGSCTSFAPGGSLTDSEPGGSCTPLLAPGGSCTPLLAPGGSFTPSLAPGGSETPPLCGAASLSVVLLSAGAACEMDALAASAALFSACEWITTNHQTEASVTNTVIKGTKLITKLLTNKPQDTRMSAT